MMKSSEEIKLLDLILTSVVVGLDALAAILVVLDQPSKS